MRLINKYNHGVVDVSDEYAERLLRSGEWKKPAKPKATRSRAKKTEEG